MGKRKKLWNKIYLVVINVSSNGGKEKNGAL